MLWQLNLSYNKIEDISPLISLPQLRDLNLSNNKIVDISPLINLNFESYFFSIDLSHNCITDISPLFKLPKDIKLEEGIDLGGNPISDRDLSYLKKHFINDIIY
jgi:Leucine-rich repeat (LRR) protein